MGMVGVHWRWVDKVIVGREGCSGVKFDRIEVWMDWG